ncbi:hypothetical protein [uncultured Marinococcus sp.]|uniref:hypothetical protein n=1 Tax=uncultured Marinococcus sp. TaxID=487012 RepID=UPI00261B602D|nr:hypothetical protein [uncultured Marinococcus sp.]
MEAEFFFRSILMPAVVIFCLIFYLTLFWVYRRGRLSRSKNKNARQAKIIRNGFVLTGFLAFIWFLSFYI